MKSACILVSPLLDENRPLRFSFSAVFRRLFRSFCSARTLAVREAVPEFRMPLVALPVVWLVGTAFGDLPLSAVASTAVVPFVMSVFFLFFPAPGAFLRECVRPRSFSFDDLRFKRSLSLSEVGSIVMTSSGLYDLLHYIASVSDYCYYRISLYVPASRNRLQSL